MTYWTNIIWYYIVAICYSLTAFTIHESGGFLLWLIMGLGFERLARLKH